MKCNNCNEIIPDDSIFCTKCGKRVKKIEFNQESLFYYHLKNLAILLFVLAFVVDNIISGMIDIAVPFFTYLSSFIYLCVIVITFYIFRKIRNQRDIMNNSSTLLAISSMSFLFFLLNLVNVK